jgi:hypothetical protein
LALMKAAEQSTQLFNLRLLVVLIVVGITAFAAFMVLAAYSSGLRPGRFGHARAPSAAAVGFKGLVDLIGYSGGTARLVRSGEELGTEDLLVIAPDESTDQKVIAAVVRARAAKPTLLILPKWNTVPGDRGGRWVRTVGLYPSAYVAASIGANDRRFGNQCSASTRQTSGSHHPA